MPLVEKCLVFKEKIGFKLKKTYMNQVQKELKSLTLVATRRQNLDNVAFEIQCLAKKLVFL